jgi:SAM-dependent methyltransferase
MTIDTMRWHEAVNVHYDTDFRRQSLVQLALRHVVGPSVLDMRCITGSLVIPLVEKGYDVYALDGYDGAVGKTNERLQAKGLKPIAHTWDLTGLVDRVGRDRFDTVVCLDVLNHALDDSACVAEIVQVVKPGGRVIFAVPAFPALLGPRDKSLGHLRRYTRRGIREAIEKHGLVIDRLRFWNFVALPLFWFLEAGINVRISDGFRYGWWGGLKQIPNRVFTLWYSWIENNVVFPLGLTHFVIAHRPSGERTAPAGR